MDVRDFLLLSDQTRTAADEVRHAARMHEGDQSKLFTDIAYILSSMADSFEARAMGEAASFETSELDRLEVKLGYLLQDESIRPSGVTALFRVKDLLGKVGKFI